MGPVTAYAGGVDQAKSTPSADGDQLSREGAAGQRAADDLGLVPAQQLGEGRSVQGRIRRGWKNSMSRSSQRSPWWTRRVREVPAAGRDEV